MAQTVKFLIRHPLKHCALLLLVISIAPAQTYVNGMAARAVIGQKTFTAQDIPALPTLPDQYQPGLGPWLLGAPSGVAYAKGMLFVADSNDIGATPSAVLNASLHGVVVGEGVRPCNRNRSEGLIRSA